MIVHQRDRLLMRARRAWWRLLHLVQLAGAALLVAACVIAALAAGGCTVSIPFRG